MVPDQIAGDLPIKSLFADDELIGEILPAYVNNLSKYVQDLRQHIGAGDWLAAAKVCHDLKGTAGGYGYPQLGAAAQQLEAELKGMHAPIELSRLLEQLATLCRQALLGLTH
jgi:HPt (histidine-containing phosphotransfer) domain-containing protein